MYSITTRWSVISAIVLIGGVAFAEIDTSTRFPNLQDLNFGNLPGNVSLPGNLPINMSNIPTLEESEKLFKEKCKKMGHPEAYATALAAKDEVQECVKSLVNVTVLQAEMEAAKPTGDLDIVFKKYCRQSPNLQYCITNFTASIEPCLDEKERENKYLIQNITDSVVKFICFKEGDRIALFIAEGGPECLSANQDAIQSCVNATVMKNMPKDTLSIDNMPSLVLGEEQCRDITALQLCVVKSLETCSEPTPANIVDSMFNFVRKMTPCAKGFRKDSRSVSDGSASNTAAVVTVLALLCITVFAR